MAAESSAEQSSAPAAPALLTDQQCPGCGETIRAFGPAMAGCSSCGVVSTGVHCGGCGAATRMNLHAETPEGWAQVTAGPAAVHVCSVGCLVPVADALVVDGALSAGPDPAGKSG